MGLQVVTTGMIRKNATLLKANRYIFQKFQLRILNIWLSRQSDGDSFPGALVQRRTRPIVQLFAFHPLGSNSREI